MFIKYAGVSWNPDFVPAARYKVAEHVPFAMISYVSALKNSPQGRTDLLEMLELVKADGYEYIWWDWLVIINPPAGQPSNYKQAEFEKTMSWATNHANIVAICWPTYGAAYSYLSRPWCIAELLCSTSRGVFRVYSREATGLMDKKTGILDGRALRSFAFGRVSSLYSLFFLLSNLIFFSTAGLVVYVTSVPAAFAIMEALPPPTDNWFIDASRFMFTSMFVVTAIVFFGFQAHFLYTRNLTLENFFPTDLLRLLVAASASAEAEAEAGAGAEVDVSAPEAAASMDRNTSAAAKDSQTTPPLTPGQVRAQLVQAIQAAGHLTGKIWDLSDAPRYVRVCSEGVTACLT